MLGKGIPEGLGSFQPGETSQAQLLASQALGGWNTQVQYDSRAVRSATNMVLLRPSVMSAMRNPRVPRTNGPVCGGVVKSSTPSLPLQAT
jgi:hypothetical protein